MKDIRGYYFITDSSLTKKGIISDVEAAVMAGAKVVQYRNKAASSRQLYEEAFRIMKSCPNSIFLINDRVDIALAVDADGVHLGQDDMPILAARRLLGKKIIGITVHTLDQVKEAVKAGANYLAVSPVFSTSTKHDAGAPVGVEFIKKVKETVSVPVIAIGGIDLTNAQSVIDAGADGLCAVSAVVTKDDVKEEIVKFQRLFKL
jgi:thiamine-phosphate pyrophosphorylase